MSSRLGLDRAPVGLPRLQTSNQRPSTAPQSTTPTSAVNEGPPFANKTALAKHGWETKPSHQNFVLTDPIAFRYLEEDPTTRVVERRTELQGYECYIVEQWTTSRDQPTCMITTHTGDLSHVVVVGVLGVPTDESTWSVRLKVYFRALNQLHAKRRETPLGILMATNLLSVPSSLTVIRVPNGDLGKHRFDFSVNEDLKRLGCSGRVGLSLLAPTGATIAKFHQLYHTSDKNETYRAVIELVKLCQSALMLFDKLEMDYIDGLLCDVTEHAINDWWRDLGNYYYQIEPHDGILGPTTVAGLLGLVMGARNRLNAVNAPVAKDAFDVEAMKKGIGAFQKQQRIPRTRRLDRRTMDRLHKATEKQASHGTWAVPRAVKSTVAEISGKGGDTVVDVAGRKDRAGIAEIETCEIDRFVQLVFGERPKWLWYAKPMKKNRDNVGENLRLDDDEGVFGKEVTPKEGEQGSFSWTGKIHIGDSAFLNKRPTTSGEQGEAAAEGDCEELDGSQSKPGSRRATGSRDIRSGMDRLKGAVGLGGHHEQHPKLSKEDDQPSSPKTPVAEGEKRRRPMLRRAKTSPSSTFASPGGADADSRPDSSHTQKLAASKFKFPDTTASSNALAAVISQQDLTQTVSPSYASSNKYQPGGSGQQRAGPDQAPGMRSNGVTPSMTMLAGSMYHDVNLDEVLPTGPETAHGVGRLLRRTISFSPCIDMDNMPHSDDAYPRHLSFSLAEDSVLTWSPVTKDNDRQESYFGDPKVQLANEEFYAREAKRLRYLIQTVGASTTPWTDSRLRSLDDLINTVNQTRSQVEALYYPLVDSVQGLHGSSEVVIRTQKDILEEGGKEIEMLGAKLEYEMNGLRSRIEDVGAGVQDFEKGVGRVEERVRELEKDEERDGRGWSCTVQ